MELSTGPYISLDEKQVLLADPRYFFSEDGGPAALRTGSSP